MLYVLVALALPHGYGHRRHRELFRHNEEGVAEQQIDALTLKLEKLEDKVDELMISNEERTSNTDSNPCSPCKGQGTLGKGLDRAKSMGKDAEDANAFVGCTKEACAKAKSVVGGTPGTCKWVEGTTPGGSKYNQCVKRQKSADGGSAGKFSNGVRVVDR